MRSIIVCAPAPFNTICIPCDDDDDDDISLSIIQNLLSSRLPASLLHDTHIRRPSHSSPSQQHLTVLLTCRLPGGKGGFGSQLRAAGGRKGKKKQDANRDAMADVSGRRLRTVKYADSLVAQITAAKAGTGDGSTDRARKREDLVRVLAADGGRQGRVVFDDEEYFGTSERLLVDLKDAMSRVYEESSSSSSEEGEEEDDEEEEEEGHERGGPSRGKKDNQVLEPVKVGPRRLQGWDEDDDDNDEEEEEEEDSTEEEVQETSVSSATQGKGKQKVPIKTTPDSHLRKRVRAS